MATAGKINAIITKSRLVCALCLNPLRNPRFLQCHHSFCTECIKDITSYNHNNNAAQVICPTCFQETCLPLGDVHMLKSDSRVKTFFDELPATPHLDSRGRFECNVCESTARGLEVYATCHCFDCGRNMCASCAHAHDQFPSTANHEVYQLIDTRTQQHSADTPRDQFSVNEEALPTQLRKGSLASAVELRSIVKSSFQCAICHGILTDPRFLDCHHTYCSRCIRKVAKRQDKTSGITCPTCSKETQLPREDIHLLKPDARVDDIFNALPLSGDSVSLIYCMVCGSHGGKDALASTYCHDCDINMCVCCESVHQRLPVTAQHCTAKICQRLRSSSERDFESSVESTGTADFGDMLHVLHVGRSNPDGLPSIRESNSVLYESDRFGYDDEFRVDKRNNINSSSVDIDIATGTQRCNPGNINQQRHLGDKEYDPREQDPLKPGVTKGKKRRICCTCC